MMSTLCETSVHSFLGLTNPMDEYYNNNNKKKISSSCKHAGPGLITAATASGDDGDAYRPSSPSVIQSSILKGLPSPPPPATTTPLFTYPSVFSKKDPGGIGFIDDMGGGVDGLMCCTESLGFESSDERTVDDRHQKMELMEMDTRMNQSSCKVRWRKDHHHHHEVKKFPPPLSSFNRNGQPSFFLRSVRTDGRLELTEVRIDRPEILRASREDGRLRLHLIKEDEAEEEILEEDEEEVEEETLEEEEEEEEEGRVGEWKLEGFRRCNEVIGHRRRHHHHHNQLHVWSQHCVPTR